MVATSPIQRRYPGVRHFEERDQTQFRGRTAATEELLLRVLSVRLLLQFAPSGVGKTSLLTAGLFPLLRPHHYFPFIVRLNLPEEPLVQAVRRSLTAALADFKLNEPVVPAQAQDLWSLLAGTQLWTADLMLLTPVLVFDQFEEIFTLRDAGFRDEFARQVGELATADAQGEAASDQTRKPPPAKFIISLREEYLGKLEEFSSRIPELFRERLRLAPLSADEARQAIVEPAALPGGEWASPPFGYGDNTVSELIDFIDGSSATVRVIEPLTLQLVCRRAEDIAIERAGAGGRITLQMHDFDGLTGLERLVRGHYEEVLAKIEPERARRRAKRMFERGLLDPSGKRLMLEEGEIQRDYEIEVSTLDTLVASSVLRREPRNESVFYEISHDRLTETIARHRSMVLPGWVLPTLGVGALLIAAGVVGVVGFFWQARLTAQADAARDEAEYALGQLLGESLVSRLREAGLADALGQILERSAPGTPRDGHAPGLASVLRLRHEGDIARDSATLAKAQERYLRALSALDALPGSNPPRATLLAERARIGTALGVLALDAGQLALAQAHLNESVRHWQAALDAAALPRPLDLLDAADSRLVRGRLFSRTGDYYRAEEEALAASRLALQVLKQAYGGEQAPALDANYDTGRAMQVFADAALNLHATWQDPRLAEAMLALAREAVRLRPLSFQAQKQLGTVIANGSAATPLATNADWDTLLVESRGLFDKLGADAGNLSMRRERAALETLIGQTIAGCIAKAAGCRGLPEGEIDRSRVGVLESIGTFRWLASKDPDNRSWNSDVAWALRVRSQQQANMGDPAAIATLQQAIGWAARVPMAPQDFDARWERATDLMQLAEVHSKASRRSEVRSAIDGALALFDDAAGQSVGAQLARIALFEQAIALLKSLRMDHDASLLKKRLAELPRPSGGPAQKSFDRAIELNQQAIDLSKKTVGKAGAQGRADGLRVEQLHAQAVDEYPFDPVLWHNLRAARQDAAALADSGSPEHEQAMRRLLFAAWMAKVLRPTDADYLRELYRARRGLAIHLYDKGSSNVQLQALVDRALQDAKEMVRGQSASNDARLYLADANLGVGYIRDAQGTYGWDEAFRVALLHGEERAKQAPDTAEPLVWLAEQRRVFAQRLERDQRADEAAEQRRLALRSCRGALAMPRASEEDRQQAQACVDEQAGSGVR